MALEMRLPESARATKDIDVIAEAKDERGLAEVLEQALAVDYQNFTFRSWSTVQVDLSRGEGDTTEVELVDPLALEPFGLDTPPALPCLSLRYHSTQWVRVDWSCGLRVQALSREVRQALAPLGR